MKNKYILCALALTCNYANYANARTYSTDLLKAVTDVKRVTQTEQVELSRVGPPLLSYSFTTNLTNPNCDTGFGGYVDLQGFNILTLPTVIGDEAAFTAFAVQNPFRFYGIEQTNLTFSTNGLIHFGADVTQSVNTALPDATLPNNIIALFWNDMEVFYDMALNHGISIANAGPNVSIIEFDDPQPKGGGPSIGDFEIILNFPISNQPDTPEIVIAFGTMGTLPASATVGVEDATGTVATQFMFGDPSLTITDNLIVCFEAEGDVPVELMNYSID